MNPSSEAFCGSTLGKWLEFLATPPAFERVAPHSDDEAESPYLDCLPSTLFDDARPSSCPEFAHPRCFGQGIPSTFVPESFGEAETRILQISNVDPDTTSEELDTTFGYYGEIDSVDIGNVRFGIATVKFFDLQAALKARQSRIVLRGKVLMMLFGAPDPVCNPRKPPNNGTVVVFHLRKGVTDEQIREEFVKFGDIRQIRSAPGKQTQRFIEYWDTRSAEQALKGMKSKKIFESKISVEYSLPGGYRKAHAPTQPSGPRLPTIERVPHYQSSRSSYY
jgi:RNA recognition motif-containing protein